MKTIEGYDVKIFSDSVEETAIEQIRNLMAIDVFADKKIRVMPDVHAGAGCVIGFTGDLGEKVIPNIVGVDIGCGMRVVKIDKLKHIDFHKFHSFIASNIPAGLDVRDKKTSFRQFGDEETAIYEQAKQLVDSLHCRSELKYVDRIVNSIGTLGGGNHFIELGKDEAGALYLIIHTGSRNLGKQVADIYQALAVASMTEGLLDIEDRIRQTIEEYCAAGREHELQNQIKRMRKRARDARPSLPPNLCYLEGELRDKYLHDMRLCQQWAVLNRTLIARLLMKILRGAEIAVEFESVHNYISDDNIIRKGAISAQKGQRCVIPLNMRDGSLICTGLGNDDWNCSAPHGAGRVLGRKEAYRKISMDDFRQSMQGIYSETVNEFTRDESPMVYKPASEIISAIGDTVSIDAVVRPVFNFKASK